jgi:hypothetical protein
LTKKVNSLVCLIQQHKKRPQAKPAVKFSGRKRSRSRTKGVSLSAVSINIIVYRYESNIKKLFRIVFILLIDPDFMTQRFVIHYCFHSSNITSERNALSEIVRPAKMSRLRSGFTLSPSQCSAASILLPSPLVSRSYCASSSR